MTVNKGLKKLAEGTPQFSNQGVQNTINGTLIGFVIKTKTIADTVDTTSLLTDAQKTTLKNSMDTFPYLNTGRYLRDLDQHTQKLLTGVLGAPDPFGGEDRGNFLEHLQLVESIEQITQTFFGISADDNGKGLDDHFGTLNSFLNDGLIAIQNALTYINNAELSTDTAFQTACTNIINFLLDPSAYSSNSVESDLLTLSSAVESAEADFNTALSVEPYLTQRDVIATNRSIIETQINKETTNIYGLRTYVDSLAETSRYEGLAQNPPFAKFMSRLSANPDYRDYFDNYANRSTQINPMYNDNVQDSSKEKIIETALRMKGLPDVTDFVDLEAVIKKAKKDTRISTDNFDSKTNEEIIKDCCIQLKITITGRNVYEQSKELLNNMNKNDRTIIEQELETHRTLTTLS